MISSRSWKASGLLASSVLALSWSNSGHFFPREVFLRVPELVDGILALFAEGRACPELEQFQFDVLGGRGNLRQLALGYPLDLLGAPARVHDVVLVDG